MTVGMCADTERAGCPLGALTELVASPGTPFRVLLILDRIMNGTHLDLTRGGRPHE